MLVPLTFKTLVHYITQHSTFLSWKVLALKWRGKANSRNWVDEERNLKTKIRQYYTIPFNRSKHGKPIFLILIPCSFDSMRKNFDWLSVEWRWAGIGKGRDLFPHPGAHLLNNAELILTSIPSFIWRCWSMSMSLNEIPNLPLPGLNNPKII